MAGCAARSPRPAGTGTPWWWSPRVPSPPAGRRSGAGEQRPSDPAVLQAVSAVGQHRLMRLWQDGLDPHGLLAGQVLLAPLDFVHRTQYLHARGTLRHLVDLGVVPVVNENDAVADEEIRFGDNDRLAALVAHLVGAELLVLLTDTPGPADGRSPARHRGVADRGGRRDRPPAGAPGRRPGQHARQRRHGVEAGRGQDRHLVGRADRHRRRRSPGRAGRRARRGGRGGDGVPGPGGPPLGPQALDRLRPGLLGAPDGRRGRTGGADRTWALAPGRGRRRGRRQASGPRTRSRSPGPTARSSPRAWSGSMRSGRGSGWGGAARSSSTGTTWSL